jgi:hypothetical protein
MGKYVAHWIRWAALSVLGVNGCSCVCKSPPPATRPAESEPVSEAVVATPPPPPLRVEQFESGELQVSAVSDAQLIGFLRDLNQRRDYDYSQHDDMAGPNNAYLTRWIHSAITELLHRGYYVDSFGELHTPGAIISTR